MNMMVQAADRFFVSDPPRWLVSLGVPLVFSLSADKALVMSALDAAFTVTRLKSIAGGATYSMVPTDKPINYHRSRHAGTVQVKVGPGQDCQVAR